MLKTRPLNSHGNVARVALISLTRSSRHSSSEIIGSNRMREIYIARPLELCQQGDVKASYAKASQEACLQLTRLKAPYGSPLYPDLRIDTAQYSVEQGIQKMMMELIL
ncbi:adenylyl-sulfate kinase [Undibacterium sp. WLHG33]|uniref:adenylyl-sulfate kinase n=1 Tax=Undibacterium sp. WLHG33 TaxID=3412482 RepID=UPI003C2E0D0E